MLGSADADVRHPREPRLEGALFSVTPGCSVPTARGAVRRRPRLTRGLYSVSASVGLFSVKPGCLPTPTARGHEWRAPRLYPQGHQPGARMATPVVASLRSKISFLLDGIVKPPAGHAWSSGPGHSRPGEQ